MDLTKLTQIKEYNKAPSSVYRIRFQDCDPFQHLNQASYLNYFLTAREDHLRFNYDLDLFKLAMENGLGWMVIKNQIAYLRQVMVNEQVIIETYVTGYDDTNISIEAIMWDEAKLKPKSLLWASFAFVHLGLGKRSPHPAELMDFFAKIKSDGLNEGVTFDERIAQMYKLNKL